MLVPVLQLISPVCKTVHPFSLPEAEAPERKPSPLPYALSSVLGSAKLFLQLDSGFSASLLNPIVEREGSALCG
jgi:hypothetical protein